MFLVTKSIHSLFSGSTNCLITTSYPFKSEALCIKVTVVLLWVFPLNSRLGGPSCDSSITLLTKASLLPRGGERVQGLHNEHVISKDSVTAPGQNITDAAASSRHQVSPSPVTLPLKNHNCYGKCSYNDLSNDLDISRQVSTLKKVCKTCL